MKKKALKSAFPYTIPIGIGFLFLGMSYADRGILSGSGGQRQTFILWTFHAG